MGPRARDVEAARPRRCPPSSNRAWNLERSVTRPRVTSGAPGRRTRRAAGRRLGRVGLRGPGAVGAAGGCLEPRYRAGHGCRGRRAGHGGRGGGRGRRLLHPADGSAGRVRRRRLRQRHQRRALERLESKARREGLANIQVVAGDVDDPRFPRQDLELVVIVHAFHDFSQPVEWLGNVRTYCVRARRWRSSTGIRRRAATSTSGRATASSATRRRPGSSRSRWLTTSPGT